MKRKSYRANNPVSVLDGNDLVDNSQPLGVDNLPIGMRDTSMAAGTPRKSQEGRCYVGDGNAFVTIPNIDFTGITNWQIDFEIDLSVGIINQSFFWGLNYLNGDSGLAFGIDNVGVLKLIIYKVGVDEVITVPAPFLGVNKGKVIYDGSIISLYINDALIGTLNIAVILSSGVSNIGSVFSLTTLAMKTGHKLHYFKITNTSNNSILQLYKCDEQSGDIAYDSSGNNNHGDIVNLYAGFHGTQDIYSWSNTVGYSNYTYMTEGDNQIVIDDGMAIDDYLEFYILTVDDPFLLIMTGDEVNTALAANSGFFGNVNSNNFSGNVDLFVDDIQVFDFTDQSVFHSLIGDGQPHKIKFINKNIDRSSDILKIGNYSIVQSYKYTGYISTVKKYNSSDILLNSYNSNNIVYVPRDESIQLPPFKDVLGNPLQYIGLCPSKAKLVNTPCFQGDGSGVYNLGTIPELQLQNIELEFWYMKASASVRTRPVGIEGGIDALSDEGESGTNFIVRNTLGTGLVYCQSPTNPATLNKYNLKCYNNTAVAYTNDIPGTPVTVGTINMGANITTIGALYSTYINPIATGDKMRDVKVYSLDSNGNRIALLLWVPLCEPIKDPSNHTAFDVVGGNHATLVNGSLSNNGIANRPEGDYGQLGYSETISTDGVDDLLDTLYFPQPDTKITIWAKFNNYPNTENYLLGYQDAGTPRIQLGVVINKWYARWGNVAYQSEDADTDWHKFEFTKSELKIDGATIYTITSTDPIGPPVNPLFIFARNSSVFGQNHVNVEFNRCLIEESGVPILDFRTKEDLIEDVLTGTLYSNKVGVTPTVFTNGQSIPASATDLTKDALGNPLTVQQDGNSFLDTGTELQHYPMPRVIQADGNMAYFKGNGASYMNIGNVPIYEDNIEVSFYYKAISDVTRRRHFGIQGASGEGFDMLWQTLPTSSPQIYFRTSSGNEIFNFPPDFPVGAWVKCTIKVYGTNYSIDFEGSTGANVGVLTGSIVYGGSGLTTIASNYLGANPLLAGEELRDFKINKLDASGNFLEELGMWELSRSYFNGSGFSDKVNNNDAALVGAESWSSFWVDASGEPISKEHGDFIGVYSDGIFSDISETDKVKNIRTHKQALAGRQLNTEKQITNN